MLQNVHAWLLRFRANRWLFLALLGLGLLLPAGVALAAGDATGCDDVAPSGWMRTIWWVDGQTWSPSQAGPWSNGTTVSVRESNARGAVCDSSGPGEAYQDGVIWWGTFRTDYVVTGRGIGDPAPYGRHRFTRDSWWNGWVRPAIGGQKVAGYWLRSTGPSVGNESVFVAGDSEVWIEVGSFSVEARCMSPTGPLVPVNFSARNANGSWSAANSGTNWNVGNAAGPGPWTVSAAGFGWSGSAALSDNGTSTFIVTGCGSAGGGVSVEAHCHSTTGPFVNAGAFDAWEDTYWRSGGWYASAGYGASASFSVPTGASTPITVRVWWPDGTQAQQTTNVGGVVRFVTTNAALCTSPTSSSIQPTPVPPPAPCTAGAGPYDGSYINVWANVANGGGTLHTTGDGTEWTPPTGAANTVTVAPNQPLTITFDHILNGMAYSVDHDGRTKVTYGIRDITGGANTNLVYIQTEDEKELKDSAGTVHVWGYSTKVTTAQMTPGVSFGGVARWRRWNATHATWGNPDVVPAVNMFFADTGGQTAMSFTPEQGRTYEVFAMAGHGACTISPNHRWSRLIINARQMQVNLIEVDLTGKPIGPIANFPIMYSSYRTGEWLPNITSTNREGRLSYDFPTGYKTGVAPGFVGYNAWETAAPGWTLWKAEHTCPGSVRLSYNGTHKGFWDTENPCTATLYYARVPTINVSARHEETGAALPNVPMVIKNAHDVTLAQGATDGAGNRSFVFDETTTRNQIGATSFFWRLSAGANAGPTLPIFRAVAGTHATVQNEDLIHITPAQSSSGTVFYYKPPRRTLSVSGSVRTADNAPDPDKPVAYANVAVTVRNGAGITLDSRFITTDGVGNYAYTNPNLPDDQSLSVTMYLDSWDGTSYHDYISNQSYPGTTSPASAGSVARVDTRTLRLTLAASTGPISSVNNTFDLTNNIPPPQGPTLDWKLYLHSHYDGSNVYLSDNDQITWPEGETLDWMPRITATPAAHQTVGSDTYRFDTKIVAWSFVSSEGVSATSADAMGRSGCRARHKPKWDGGNASMLDGCAYFYDMDFTTAPPNVGEINQQAHAFWSMQTPQDMEPWTYVYQLTKLKRVDLRVQALVKVQTVKLANPLTGAAEAPVGNPIFLKVEKPAPFYVNLVAPRSTR